MCELIISEEEIKQERKYWYEAEDEAEDAADAEENTDDGDPMNGRADGCDGWD